MTSLSDEELDKMIEEYDKISGSLKELKRLRTEKKYNYKSPTHHLVDWRGTDDKITSAICSCGEETKYRVPLTDTKDFVCPRDPNREGRKET